MNGRRVRAARLAKFHHDGLGVGDALSGVVLEGGFEVGATVECPRVAAGPFVGGRAFGMDGKGRGGDHLLQGRLLLILGTQFTDDKQVQVLREPLDDPHLLKTGAALEDDVIGVCSGDGPEGLAHPVVLFDREWLGADPLGCGEYGFFEQVAIVVAPVLREGGQPAARTELVRPVFDLRPAAEAGRGFAMSDFFIVLVAVVPVVLVVMDRYPDFCVGFL